MLYVNNKAVSAYINSLTLVTENTEICSTNVAQNDDANSVNAAENDWTDW